MNKEQFTDLLAECRQERDALKAANATLKEECCVLASQVENADINLEQAKFSARAQWERKVESAESKIEALNSEKVELCAALRPFAEPHGMGDNYVQFAPRLIQAAREALAKHRP